MLLFTRKIYIDCVRFQMKCQNISNVWHQFDILKIPFNALFMFNFNEVRFDVVIYKYYNSIDVCNNIWIISLFERLYIYKLLDLFCMTILVVYIRYRCEKYSSSWRSRYIYIYVYYVCKAVWQISLSLSLSLILFMLDYQ